MCQVRLDDYHGAQASFLNAIRFYPDNQIYLKNLHELTKNLKAPDRRTELPVNVRIIKHSLKACMTMDPYTIRPFQGSIIYTLNRL